MNYKTTATRSLLQNIYLTSIELPGEVNKCKLYIGILSLMSSSFISFTIANLLVTSVLSVSNHSLLLKYIYSLCRVLKSIHFGPVTAPCAAILNVLEGASES